MADFVSVGAADQLTDGKMKEVLVGKTQVLLARIGGNYYATQGRCPHMGGILANGRLDGSMVTCPRHGSQFIVTDGKLVRWTNWTGLMLTIGKMFKSPRGLKTYPVKIENGNIMVKVD